MSDWEQPQWSKEIAYYYNGVLHAEETELDLDGDKKIPAEGEVVVRPDKKTMEGREGDDQARQGKCAADLYGLFDFGATELDSSGKTLERPLENTDRRRS